MEKNILKDLWLYLEKENKTKIEQKVYNWLNKDNLNTIVLTKDNIFWFEATNTSNYIPNYIYYWLKKWVKEHFKANYLYDPAGYNRY